MSLLFVDVAGNKGRIRDDFSVAYHGPVHVEEYVNDVVDDAASDGQATEDILVDMIHDLDIKEVRREQPRKSTSTLPQ